VGAVAPRAASTVRQLAARLELLQAEKALTRRTDDVARQRQELPWVSIGKQYRFDVDEGPALLADLFQGRSQLLAYHFIFGPGYTAGCRVRDLRPPAGQESSRNARAEAIVSTDWEPTGTKGPG
jgi:predicted dithiol-disulfide oxidoreductase (DUF899 family)